MMQAILKCSGRIVEVEPIPGDADHMIVFGTVFLRTGWDADGLRPVHIVPIDKLEITTPARSVAKEAYRPWTTPISGEQDSGTQDPSD